MTNAAAHQNAHGGHGKIRAKQSNGVQAALAPATHSYERRVRGQTGETHRELVGSTHTSQDKITAVLPCENTPGRSKRTDESKKTAEFHFPGKSCDRSKRTNGRTNSNSRAIKTSRPAPSRESERTGPPCSIYLLRASHGGVLLPEGDGLGAHVASHGRGHAVRRLDEGGGGPHQAVGHLHLLHALLSEELLEPLAEAWCSRWGEVQEPRVRTATRTATVNGRQILLKHVASRSSSKTERWDMDTS